MKSDLGEGRVLYLRKWGLWKNGVWQLPIRRPETRNTVFIVQLPDWHPNLLRGFLAFDAY